MLIPGRSEADGVWDPQEAWQAKERLQLEFFCRGESEELGLQGKQRAEKVSKQTTCSSSKHGQSFHRLFYV